MSIVKLQLSLTSNLMDIVFPIFIFSLRRLQIFSWRIVATLQHFFDWWVYIPIVKGFRKSNQGWPKCCDFQAARNVAMHPSLSVTHGSCLRGVRSSARLLWGAPPAISSLNRFGQDGGSQGEAPPKKPKQNHLWKPFGCQVLNDLNLWYGRNYHGGLLRG
jgi:hypothetical protein